jgi:predicted membrane protein
VFQVFKCNKKVLLFVNIYNDCTYISHRQNLLAIACLIYLFINVFIIIYTLHCLVYFFFFFTFLYPMIVPVWINRNKQQFEFEFEPDYITQQFLTLHALP